MKNTGFEENSITDNQRESCSVLVMQKLLEKYSKELRGEVYNEEYRKVYNKIKNEISYKIKEELLLIF